MARQFRCPRPINRLIPMRSRGLSGPFFQNIGGGLCVHTAGNYLASVGSEIVELIGQFLVPDPDHIMTGVLLGEGDLTVSRAATVDVPDGEGTDQTFGTAEPAWGGGRVTGSIGSRVVYDTDSEGVEYADPTWLAVTAGDSHTLDSANLSDYQGSLYVEVWMNGDDNILNGFLYRESGDGGQLLTLDDGTTQVTAAMLDDEWHEIGVAWSTLDAKMDLFFDGSWIGEVAYDGSLLSGNLDLFRDATNGGRMRNLRIYSDGGVDPNPIPPYTELMDLLQIDETTGEITLADGVTYEHTSDVYALDADGVYLKFGTDVPIVSGARCTVAGGYVTNVYATDALGDPLDPPPQLVYQPALSNIEDESVADIVVNGTAWTSSGTATTQSSRGIVEGYFAVPDSTTIARYFNPFPSDCAYVSGTRYAFEVIAKSDGWQWIQLTTGAALSQSQTIWANYDLTNKAFGNIGANVVDYQAEELGNGHIRLVMEFVGNANLDPFNGVVLYLANSNVSARAPTSTGDTVSGLTVTQMGVYSGATAKQVLGSGPIFTAGSTLATDRTVIQPPLTAHDNDAGLWYLDAEWSVPETATAQGVISVDGAAEGSVLAYTAASGFIASNDGVTTSAIAASNFVMPGSLKHCIVYSQADNKMRLFMDGALAGTEVAFDGFNLGTVVDLLLSCGYPVKINDLKSYSISSYDDGIALKDELLA